MKIKFLTFSIISFTVLLFSGCTMTELFKKSDEIQKIVSDNCSCDQSRLLNYSRENFTETLYIEIIGSDVSSRKELALKINQILKKQVDGYCDIDDFTLDFINKKQSEVYTFHDCELETNE